ncbi:MAG: ABC transporter ATP-binding protein [Pseudomonadales bacterium]
MSRDDVLLKVEELSVDYQVEGAGFFSPQQSLRAVSGVSFEVCAGETVGVVGESGCGKSSLGRALIKLVASSQGKITWRGRRIDQLPEREFRDIRRDLQMIFQDPLASLNPRMTVASIIAEPLQVFLDAQSREEVRERVLKVMDAVGLPARLQNRFPHEFSGGQAQRIGIARAIVSNPKFIVCDEPVSALDVSIQAQIINLLMKLKKEMGLTLLFISHDLAVVHHLADKILVLYLGKVVEFGDAKLLSEQPLHPYTQMLYSAMPIADPIKARRQRRVKPVGEPPSPLNPPSGCVFHTRCPQAVERCKREIPALRPLHGREIACHLIEEQSWGTGTL